MYEWSVYIKVTIFICRILRSVYELKIVFLPCLNRISFELAFRENNRFQTLLIILVYILSNFVYIEYLLYLLEIWKSFIQYTEELIMFHALVDVVFSIKKRKVLTHVKVDYIN